MKNERGIALKSFNIHWHLVLESDFWEIVNLGISKFWNLKLSGWISANMKPSEIKFFNAWNISNSSCEWRWFESQKTFSFLFTFFVSRNQFWLIVSRVVFVVFTVFAFSRVGTTVSQKISEQYQCNSHYKTDSEDPRWIEWHLFTNLKNKLKESTSNFFDSRLQHRSQDWAQSGWITFSLLASMRRLKLTARETSFRKFTTRERKSQQLDLVCGVRDKKKLIETKPRVIAEKTKSRRRVQHIFWLPRVKNPFRSQTKRKSHFRCNCFPIGNPFVLVVSEICAKHMFPRCNPWWYKVASREGTVEALECEKKNFWHLHVGFMFLCL